MEIKGTIPEGSLKSTLFNGRAGSLEHKAARWREYVDSFKPGGSRYGKEMWSYETWSKTYDKNMIRARVAGKSVIDYHQKLGWGTIKQVDLDAGGLVRRLDITDVVNRRGVEVKSSTQLRNFSLDPFVSSEIARDKWLIQHGWDIEWHFEVKMGISDGLREALESAGIRITGV